MKFAYSPIRWIQRIRNAHPGLVDDAVAAEVPAELVFNNVSFAVMMLSPNNLQDFVNGFSLSEGLVEHIDQIMSVEIQELVEGIQIHIQTSADAMAAQLDASKQRVLPGRGSCGICGTRDLEDALKPLGKIRDKPEFNPSALEKALAELNAHQPLNNATGAAHAAFWVNDQGEIVLTREDIGRHNALDKLIGAMHSNNVAPDSGMLLLTSRASYEMVSKAARAGIGVVAAMSGPTALAVDVARSVGMTLVAFARPGGNYTIYSGDDSLNAKR